MKIRAGYEISYDRPQPTPMILTPSVHSSRFSDLQTPDLMREALQHSLETLPVEHLVYLLGRRYCETDRFTEISWSRFGNVPKGWPLVQAICLIRPSVPTPIMAVEVLI